MRYVARRRPFLSYRPRPTPSLAVRAFRGSPAIRARSVTFAFVCSPALWSNKGERVGRRRPRRGASDAFLGRKLPVFLMPPPPILHCRGFRSLPERNQLSLPRLSASHPTTCAGTLCERRILPLAGASCSKASDAAPPNFSCTYKSRTSQANCPDRWPALIRTWILVRCVWTQQLCQALGVIATPAYLTTGKDPVPPVKTRGRGYARALPAASLNGRNAGESMGCRCRIMQPCPLVASIYPLVSAAALPEAPFRVSSGPLAAILTNMR